MPPEIPAEHTLADLVARLDALHDLWAVAGATEVKAASVLDERLAAIEADLSRLLALAEQAEKFLHNPIGAYKAARLGKIKVPDGQ